MASSSRSMLTLALFCLLCLHCSVTHAQVTYYSFCYSLYSLNANSPALPWSITASGTLALTPSNGLYLVINVTGSRVLTTRNVSTNQSIIGVAALSAYENNDNLISVSAPYFDSASLHSISFVLNTNAQQVYFLSNSRYVNLFNSSATGIFTEADAPVSDGVINSIVSSFTLTPSSSFSSYVSCPLLTQSVSASASAVSQFNNTITWSFCYSFTGGPGDGTTGGKLWSVTASGVVVTSGYGVNVTSALTGALQTAYIVLSVSGTRTFSLSDNSITPQTNTFTTVVPSSGALYSSYPYFDNQGLAVNLNSAAFNVYGNASSSRLQLFTDSYLMFDETVVDGRGAAVTVGEVVGNIDLVQGVTSTSSLQCGFETGPISTYAFCYELTPDQTYSVVTYGFFSATGPQIRQGLPALTMQSMTGVRTLINATGPYSSNIIKLVYINADNISSVSTILNDNLVYVSPVNSATPPPIIDYYGFVYTLSSPLFFSSYATADSDVNLSLGDGTFYEWPVSAGLVDNGLETVNGVFSYQVANLASASPFPCQSHTVGGVTTLYFSYQISGSGYSITASGQIIVFSGATILPAAGGARTGSAVAVANMTGTRTFTSNGAATTSVITGISADSFGAVNNSYSQLLYNYNGANSSLSNVSLDTLGLLFTVSSATSTPLGSVVGTPVIRLSGLASGLSVTETVLCSGGVFQSAAGTFSLSLQAPKNSALSSLVTGGSMIPMLIVIALSALLLLS